MNCEEVQRLLHDFRKRRLEGTLRDEVAAHLENCVACASADRAERALDDLLEQRLPRHAAPASLKRRLGRVMLTERPAPAPAGRAITRWARFVAPAMAAGLAVAVGGVLLERSASQGSALASLTGEAVNDHLRVLASQHPVEIESGGKHQKALVRGQARLRSGGPAPGPTRPRISSGNCAAARRRRADSTSCSGAAVSWGMRSSPTRTRRSSPSSPVGSQPRLPNPVPDAWGGNLSASGAYGPLKGRPDQ
jgi:hypothetical protein